MNNTKQLIKTSGIHIKKEDVFGYRSKQLAPVLSKAQLHNYFADRMAMLSVIMGYIYDKIQHSKLADSFSVLYDKLSAIRADFLLSYHNHTPGRRIGLNLNKVKTAYELIYQLEEQVISEILKFGIKPAELIGFRNRTLSLQAVGGN